MKNKIKTLTVLATIILMSSFTYMNADEFIGTYGVSESDLSQIKLTINSDHTFYYQDFSNTDNKIITKGNWTKKGKKVYLKDNTSGQKFHNVWTFAENGQIAKSHRGLAFYRLCKIEG